MSKFFASLAIVAISWLLTSWLLMVAVGVVHAVWLPYMPTIGFPVALLLSLLIYARAVIGGVAMGLIKQVTGDKS